MVALLKLQFIIFALIAVGFFTRRKGMVSREGQMEHFPGIGLAIHHKEDKRKT
jgi:hypothetical protein